MKERIALEMRGADVMMAPQSMEVLLCLGWGTATFS